MDPNVAKSVSNDGGRMRIFISWSGPTSHRVALTLRDWLPSVVQALKPYVSSEDIDKGTRWSTDISQELEHSRYGILCITPDNLHAPWVNFEAGALSHALEQSRVVPFLFGLQRTSVTGPLLQFQSTVYQHEDVRKLVRGLNKACGDYGCARVDDSRLDEIFDIWWPRLKQRLDALANETPTTAVVERGEHDILTEVLELVREQHRLLSQSRAMLSPESLSSVMYDTLLVPKKHQELWEFYEKLRDLGYDIIEIRRILGALGLSEHDVAHILRIESETP
jgi:TIR domain